VKRAGHLGNGLTAPIVAWSHFSDLPMRKISVYVQILASQCPQRRDAQPAHTPSHVCALVMTAPHIRL